MILNKRKKKKKCNVLLFCCLLDTCTNKQYRRVNSGGVERSSRRGASLSSASLGSALDPDGQQGHAVVTQKRKLRTPVWARLRNIHNFRPHATCFTRPLSIQRNQTSVEKSCQLKDILLSCYCPSSSSSIPPLLPTPSTPFTCRHSLFRSHRARC